MNTAGGTAVGGAYECWVPHPCRMNASPEFAHAVRVLFGLPYEIARAGYPVKLKVPTMAQLNCFPPGKAREKLHLDAPASLSESSAPGASRELTVVLFCNSSWGEKTDGGVRAHLAADGETPGPQPEEKDSLSEREQQAASVTPSEQVLAADREVNSAEANAAEHGSGEGRPPRPTKPYKDFHPEAGRCLIFHSQRLWHEVLPARKMQFALTLFVNRA